MLTFLPEKETQFFHFHWILLVNFLLSTQTHWNQCQFFKALARVLCLCKQIRESNKDDCCSVYVCRKAPRFLTV